MLIGSEMFILMDESMTNESFHSLRMYVCMYVSNILDMYGDEHFDTLLLAYMRKFVNNNCLSPLSFRVYLRSVKPVKLQFDSLMH